MTPDLLAIIKRGTKTFPGFDYFVARNIRGGGNQSPGIFCQTLEIVGHMCGFLPPHNTPSLLVCVLGTGKSPSTPDQLHAPTLNQTNQYRDNGDDKENMDETTQGVGRDQS
jgi:hypothetical protein